MLAISFLFITLQALALVSRSYQDCPSLDPLEHGHIQMRRNFYVATCDDGYIMHGKPVAHCENNEWTRPRPECIEISVYQIYPYCRSLDPPEHGRIWMGFDYYLVTCDDGYIMHRRPVVYCKNNEWTTPRPECVEISRSYQHCPSLDPPRHGRIWMGGHYYVATCDDGYIMQGKPVVYCKNNEWTTPRPECVENCQAPSAPENGKINCDPAPWSFGKSCRFECNEGYEIEGPSERSCMNFGWSGSGVPTFCKPISSTFCPASPPLKHGTVVGCSSSRLPKVSDRCSFRCNEGYVLRGPSSLTCRENGLLTDENGQKNFPECVDIDECSDEFLNNCQHYCENTEGSYVCRCKPGYFLKDRHKCEGMECSDLIDPLHGEANCMDWMFGKLCQPRCEAGYIRDPEEPPYYSCDDSGVWEPVDVISECLKFIPANFSTCPDGYEVKPNDLFGKICIECPSNTTWSKTTEKCERTLK